MCGGQGSQASGRLSENVPLRHEGYCRRRVELGEYYFGRQEYEEAAVWFYNAAYETQSILNARRGGDMAILRLADCYEAMGIAEQAEDYRVQAAAWRLPE